MENASIYDKYNTDFATRLRLLMEEQKVTQQMLASETKLTRQAISQYADGSVLPNIERLLKIARYFNVSCDYMLGNTDVRKVDLNIQRFSAHTGLSEGAIGVLHDMWSASAMTETASQRISLDFDMVSVINYLLENEDKLELFGMMYKFMFSNYKSIPYKDFNHDSLSFPKEAVEMFEDNILVKNFIGYDFIPTDLLPYAMQNCIIDRLNEAREGMQEIVKEKFAPLQEMLAKAGEGDTNG